MNKGKVVILSGASSIGKGEIKSRLLNDPELKLMEAVSITTRPQKEDEVDGKDYYFVDYKLFAEAVKERKLLEYTEFNGYYYGTPKSQVEFMVNSGKNVLIEVSADGVGPLKLNLPDSLAIFVVPESIEQLEEQIHYFSGTNLLGAAYSIIIGAFLYLVGKNGNGNRSSFQASGKEH